MKNSQNNSLIDEIKPKINIPSKKVINYKKLEKSLNEINPEKIISEALNINISYSNANDLQNELDNSNYTSFLEQIKKQSISKYVQDIYNKNKKISINAYSKNIKEFEKSINAIIQSKNKELKTYIEKYNNILEENKILKQKIFQLNSGQKELQSEINNNSNVYFETQQLLKKFDKHKKLFYGLINEYPQSDPLEIIQNIKKDQNNIHALYEGNKNLQNKVDAIIQENLSNENKYKKMISDLNEKIILLQNSNKSSIENYENEIFLLKQEIKNLYELKEKNNNLHKMLFQVYNKLIELLKLDKEINIDDKFLGIQERDFNLNILDDNEIYNYIKIMISHLRGNSNNKLITEILAFSNMIIRRYLKDKGNLRFDPINTFKQINKIFGEQERKINKLNEIIQKNEIDMKKLYNQNKIFKNIIENNQNEKYLTINNNNDISENNIKKINNSISSLNKYKKNKLQKSISLSREINNSPYDSKLIITNDNKNNNNSNSKKLSLKGKLKKRRAISAILLIEKNKDKLNIDNLSDKKEEYIKSETITINNNFSYKQRINSYNEKLKKKLLNNTRRKNMDISKKIKIKKNKNMHIYFFNHLKSLIDHTNKLYMYGLKTKSFSYTNNKKDLSCSRFYNQKIETYREMQKYKNLLPEENIKKRIFKNINKLIENLDKEKIE